MNWAHVHLMLTHVPVVGLGFSVVLLGLTRLKSSPELQRVSLGFFVLVGLVTLPVFFTGESAEELVDRLPGVSEALLEQHEAAGTLALIAVGELAALALGWLLLSRRVRPIPRWFGITLLLLAIGVGGVMAWTANLAGTIRHTEIHGGAQALVSGGENQGERVKHIEDKD